MNYYLEISKKIEKFFNTIPVPDERVGYLEKAGTIRMLYLNSLTLQEDGVKDGEEIDKIYREIAELVD